MFCPFVISLGHVFRAFTFFLCLTVLLALPAHAEESFLFGESRASIANLPDVNACSQYSAQSLCRNNVPFAGDKWQQVFIFNGDQLVLSRLHTPQGKVQWSHMQEVLQAYGYSIIFAAAVENNRILSTLDYLSLQRSQGATKAEQALHNLQNKHHKATMEYILAPQKAAQNADTTGHNLAMRAVEDTSLAVVKVPANEPEHMVIEFCSPAGLQGTISGKNGEKTWGPSLLHSSAR